MKTNSNNVTLICLSVLCPISAWGETAATTAAATESSTAVWPAGSWLVPPGWFGPNSEILLSYGTAYFTPVLLPANSSVTKLGISQGGPADNAGQLIRLCLYRSNGNGMPGTLLKDGGETAMVTATGFDVVNFASVTTGVSKIFWIDAQLKQPSLAQFEVEEFPQGGSITSNSALAELTIGTTNGSTYSSPTPYGPCPAIAPGLSTIVSDPRGFNGNTVTLAVGIGH